MPSKVYFIDLSATFQRNIKDKIIHLLKKAGAAAIVEPREHIAIKLHFGEDGNFNYIRPQYIRIIVDFIRELGGLPFLTDTNTLYSGKRANAIEHITLALEHGFGYVATKAPVIIADGLSGEDYIELEVNAGHTTTAKIGRAIVNADALFVVSHFKGHEQMGFGGAIKNLGMGCAARLGKLYMHTSSKPYISQELCQSCFMCSRVCPTEAIYYDENKKAHIDYDKCIGCGECIVACHFGAIKNKWDESLDILSEKVAEYSLAILQHKRDKIFFINFLMNISPDCDCWSYADAPVVPDIGILASLDPVALDQACADLVNAATPISKKGLPSPKPEVDIIKSIHPDVNWRHQLEYAEKIGLGTTKYELVELK